jgi:hypothetical protein
MRQDELQEALSRVEILADAATERTENLSLLPVMGTIILALGLRLP